MQFYNSYISIPTFARTFPRTGWRKTCLFALVAVSFSVLFPTTVEAFQSSKPNIVLINLDDADAEILSRENLEAHFPTLAALARRSTVFTNAHATTPFCAPSRAALFTGQYAFNNGCKAGGESFSISNGFEGGYQRFITNGHDDNELGVWMKNAGYRTMHVGKFHHDGFENTLPPGWDDISVSRGLTLRWTAIFALAHRSLFYFHWHRLHHILQTIQTLHAWLNRGTSTTPATFASRSTHQTMTKPTSATNLTIFNVRRSEEARWLYTN